MRTRTLSVLAASVALLFTAACTRHTGGFAEMSVPDAARALNEKALFVDANTADYRKANGKVPGALLLENYRAYDPAAVLPEDKGTPLVFYCSSRL